MAEQKTQEPILEGIGITEQAAQQLKKIKREDEGEYLRALVTGGGCSGLNYQLAWDSTLNQFDKQFESHGITIVVDLKSLLYLKGMEIDYSRDMLSGGFQFKNPNAQRTCGCGTSFSV
ncbi:iron-sulfur cluster assembly accessory protein [Patescibacteria group bacterium AH-259-L07]|nr:iron-sulfur cluster assembly accessory protein [Patescibacteria group bacterium AH-259-L07]